MFVCEECGGLNKHLRSCSKYAVRIGTVYFDEKTNEYVMPGDFFGEQEERWPADQCEYCRAPGDLPHHPDCPNE